MTPEANSFSEYERLLDQLLTLNTDARNIRFRELDVSHPQYGVRLREWLHAIDHSPDFMASAFAESESLQHGQSNVGPWRPVRRVGSGGMGEVWLGERADGAFERTVAIKYILNDSGRLRTGLEAERKLLARLDHPGIARLLDGGVTSSGHPFLVAEYVDGVPIDLWCRAHKPSLSERLRLFREVCNAVSHAHEHRIVHRDIKPANVLVDSKGHTKLLDFGIAQMVQLADDANRRDVSAALTPDYATPEQLRDGSYSTRSDVYALGALLFVLLAGRTPLQVNAVDRTTLSAQVNEVAPPPPSQVAETPLAGPRRLLGDIDAITLKALAKDPEQRYASVDLLVADIDNALSHRPIAAAPMSMLDGLTRYLRRNRTEVAVMLVLAIGAVGFAAQTYRANQALLHAEQETRTANAVRDFLIDVFEGASPLQNRGAKLDALALLDRGETRIDEQLKAQPVLQAQLYEVLSTINIQLGRYDRALAMALKGRELMRSQSGEFLPLTVRLTSRAAEAAYQRGGPNDEVRQMLDRAIVYLRNQGAAGKSQLIYAQIYRAGLSSLDASSDSTIAMLTEAIAAALAMGSPGDAPLSLALHALGLTYEMTHRPKEAIAPFTEALQLRERILGRDHPETLATRVNLAYVTAETGSPAAAESILRAAVSANRRVFSENHPLVAQTLNVLANVLIMLGKFDEADGALQEALGIARRTTSADSPQIDAALGSLAMLSYRRGDFSLAGDYTRQTLEMRVRRNGEDDDSALTVKQNLAVLDYQMGRYAEAERQLREIIDRRRKSGGQTSFAVMHRGTILRFQGKAAEARTLHDEAIEQMTKDSGEASNATLTARLARAADYRDMGDLAAARADGNAALTGLQKISSTHPQLPQARFLLAQLNYLEGRCGGSLADMETMLATRARQQAPYLQWQTAEASLWVALCRRQTSERGWKTTDAALLADSQRKLLASPIADPFARRMAGRVGFVVAAAN